MTGSGKRLQMMIVHNEGDKAAVLDLKARTRFVTAEGQRKKLVYNGRVNIGEDKILMFTIFMLKTVNNL